MIVLGLSYAYTLSDVLYKEGGVYDKIHYSFFEDANKGTAEDDLYSGRRASEPNNNIKNYDNETNSTSSSESAVEAVSMVFNEIREILKSPTTVLPLQDYLALSGLASAALEDVEWGGYRDTRAFRSIENFVTSGTIHVSPKSLGESFASHAGIGSRCVAHGSEEEAMERIMSNTGNRTMAGVFFDVQDGEITGVKVRMNYTSVPNTNWLVFRFDSFRLALLCICFVLFAKISNPTTTTTTTTTG